MRTPASRDRGFTLVELLVVVLIIGITAVIAGIQAYKTVQRQKLAATAQNFATFSNRALTESQRRNNSTFIRIKAQNANRTTDVELLEDTNNDGTASVGDTVIDTFQLPAEISFSMVALNQIQSQSWSDNTTAVTNPRSLRCDTFGRTINPTTGVQTSAVATLVMTHEAMVSGVLTPMVVYMLRINPVWNATIDRRTF